MKSSRTHQELEAVSWVRDDLFCIKRKTQLTDIARERLQVIFVLLGRLRSLHSLFSNMLGLSRPFPGPFETSLLLDDPIAIHRQHQLPLLTLPALCNAIPRDVSLRDGWRELLLVRT